MNLNNKLNRVDQGMNSIRENFCLDNNASIETIAETAASSGLLNIFIQEEEPKLKEGIWLQASDLNYDDLRIESAVKISGEWSIDNEFGVIPINYSGRNTVRLGDYIYFMGTYTSSNCYRYHIKNAIFESIASLPIKVGGSIVVAYGTDIYIMGGLQKASTGEPVKNAYKYDTLTNSYTQLADIPTSQGGGSGAIVGSNIYIFGGKADSSYSNSWNAYKYDILNNSYTSIFCPDKSWESTAVVIGTDIYIFGGRSYGDYSNIIYKYNTLTGDLSGIATTSSKNRAGRAIAIGTNIYYFCGASQEIIKFDTTTNIVEIADFNQPNNKINFGLVLIDNDIYRIGGDDKNTIEVFSFESSSYNNNSLILVQNENMNSFIGTQLIELPKGLNRLKYKINDVFYYNTETGLNDTIPTYYGDGTDWIKFKN